MHNTIGQNVRRSREARAWTQEQLATVANVSVRTIQRIELGEVPPSADTLAGLASAFDASIDDLRRTPEEQAQLEAEAVEQLKKIEERYEIVQVDQIERASHLSPRISGADALHFDNVDLNNEAEEDVVAAFRDNLRDCLDLWNECPESHRTWERGLQEQIETLNGLGLVVAAATNSRRLVLGNGDGKAVQFAVLYVVVSRVNDKRLFIAVDKRAPVQFTY